MSITFNADEIFEIAEQIERNGAKFYRKMSEKSEDEQARQLLVDLAAMEDQHVQTFASMRTELAPGERTTPTFDPEGEAAMYLQAIADGYVFDTKTDPAEVLTGNETMGDLFRTAIRLEKESIVFYLGLREMVPEELGRDRIDGIIKQEMGHITILSKRIAAMR